MIFVNQITAARANASGQRLREIMNEKPGNFDFELNDKGVSPDFWNNNIHRNRNFNFLIYTNESDFKSGAKSLKIESTEPICLCLGAS